MAQNAFQDFDFTEEFAVRSGDRLRAGFALGTGTIVPVLLEKSAATIVDVPIRNAFEALGAGPMYTPKFRVGDQVAEKQPRPLSTRTVGVVVYIFGNHTVRDVVAVKFGDHPPITFHADDLRRVVPAAVT